MIIPIEFGKWYTSDTVTGKVYVFPLWMSKKWKYTLGVFRYNVDLDFVEYAEIAYQFLDDFKEVNFSEIDHDRVKYIINKIFTSDSFDMKMLFSGQKLGVR